MNNQMRKGTGSDYIQAKKQNAIYMSIKTDAQITGTTVNPIKKNGFFYNNMINVLVPKDCSVENDCSGGVLTNARSYQLRLDFKQGKFYNNYVCKCKNDIYCEVKDDTECGCTVNKYNTVIDCHCSTCAFN